MNKLVSGALAAAVVATSLGALPTAASAGPKNGACEYTEVCAFKNRNYANGMADIAGNDTHWTDNVFSTGGTAHNSTSSGFGLEAGHRYWVKVNRAGRWFSLDEGEYDGIWSYQDHTQWPSFNFNNKISSSLLIAW